MGTNSFTIKFEPTDEWQGTQYATTNKERERFWRSIAEIDPDKVAIEIDLCEDRFRKAFATKLRDLITSNTRTEEGSIADRAPAGALISRGTIPRLILNIDYIRYGSLEVGMIVHGAEVLADAFSGRMDLFTRFMEHYTPQALLHTIPLNPVSIHPAVASISNISQLNNEEFSDYRRAQVTRYKQKRDSAAKLNSQKIDDEAQETHKESPVDAEIGYDTEYSEDFRKGGHGEFGRAPSNSISDDKPSPARKEHHNWLKSRSDEYGNFDKINARDQNKSTSRKPNEMFWIVSNLSLLVPAVMAAIALYFGYANLNAERADIESRRKELMTTEDRIRNSMLEREKKLFEVTIGPAAGRTAASAISK